MVTLSELKWAALIFCKLCTSLEQIKTANIKEKSLKILHLETEIKHNPKGSLTQSESSTLTYNTEWRMAFRTDDKDGRRLPMNCPRGDNTSTTPTQGAKFMVMPS